MTGTIKNGKSNPEFRPDGWERFERAVDAAVKNGPKHRAKLEKARTNVKTTPSARKSGKPN